MSLFSSKELKLLRVENEALKSKIKQVQVKEGSMKHLDEVLKHLRLEISCLNEEKQTILFSISKIEEEEKEKNNQIEELNNQLEYLNFVKDDLQTQITIFTTRAEELKNTSENYQQYLSTQPLKESPEPFSPFTPEDFSAQEREINNSIKEANEKFEKLNEDESKLISDREERITEITNLKSKAKEYMQVLDEIEDRIRVGNEKVESLKQEELTLKNNLENIQKEITSLENQMKEKIDSLKEDEQKLITKIDDLKCNEQSINFRLETLKDEERTKERKIREIDTLLDEKDEVKSIIDSEQRKLMDELNEKKRTVGEAQAEYDKILIEFKTRKRELYDTEQTLNIKAQRLSAINLELLELEKKNFALKSEFAELENARNSIYLEIQKEKDIADKFSQQNKKIVELVPLLEKRKKEIEAGNVELEERFTRMFQKFNNELNEINHKRAVLEQIVVQKEKDVDEKDQLLFEKLASLEESERILNARQLEIEAFEQHLQGLKEQSEMFGTDIIKLDQEVTKRQSLNSDIRFETELLFKKKNALEQSLQELLALMNESYARSKERNSKFEDELKYYEEQLQTFRSKISASVKELDQLRASVGSLRIEEQESRGSVDKLKVMKRRLLEEIAKNQQVLQRYQRVREKLRIEPAAGKSFDEIPPKGAPSPVPQIKPQLSNR